MSAHRWVIKVLRAKDGGYYCRLVRGNTRTVWHTETYKSRRGAIRTARNLAEPLGAAVEIVAC